MVHFHPLALPNVFTIPLVGEGLGVQSWKVFCPREIQTRSLDVVPEIKVHSFRFSAPAVAALMRPLQDAAPANSHSAHVPFRRSTRIAAPADVVRLEDRIHYLLQPSLETILRDHGLSLPMEPFPFQMQGVAFLAPRARAVLADEMGLGKTMQAILSLRLLLHSGEIRRALVITPKPLMDNWRRELSMWAPEVPVTVIEGDPARRRWQWSLEESVLTLANYEVVQRDSDVLQELSTHYDIVVLDESQRIKNADGATSRAVRGITRRRSWALTGTPIENSLRDLAGIFEFVCPKRIHSDMTHAQASSATADYFLRRTKEEVLTDLPPRITHDELLELTPEQRQSYDLAEKKGSLQLSELGMAAGIPHVFELILRLKQICNFDPLTGSSAKVERLSADLEEIIACKRKAIIFSQWVETLQELKRRFSDWNCLEYHGRLSDTLRKSSLENFRDDPNANILLMSYGAGGVGLNLQFCQYVFLFDRWWNPAVEDQAIARAHRLGAAGQVFVTRFLTKNTIEERIDQILCEKRELFEGVISGVDAPTDRGLNRDELWGLFQIPRSNAA